MHLDLKASPFGVENAEIGGSSMTERVLYAFYRGGSN
jgi:hypothetical protein